MSYKSKILLVTMLLSISNIDAQNYLLTFNSNGAASSISDIEIQNLTQGTSLSISGNDVLHLVDNNSSINSSNFENLNEIRIYPNPITQKNTKIQFFQKQSGYTTIKIFDISGKQIFKKIAYLKEGISLFEINNLDRGIYFINISDSHSKLSGKIISTNNHSENLSISIKENKTDKTLQKGTSSIIDMQYNNGDLLLFKAINGNYSTIKTLVPTQDTTVTFIFYECSDVDGNNYTTVKIGNQVWMAENLRVTHYPNGYPIPLVTSSSSWGSLNPSSDAYCFYNNNSTNDYGALYTYSAALGACPNGWHLPTNNEWVTLINFLGGTNIAGKKLKETDNTHWYSPNYATNETGFSALPGGMRAGNGSFIYLRESGFWWTSSTYSTNVQAYSKSFYYGSNQTYNYYMGKDSGISVRCVKN